jgi:hypothetical protein
MTMAAKKSMPETRSRRNPPQSPAPPALNFEPLRRHIEAERSRLTDAEAVLDCIIHAMEEDERLDVAGPRYPNVVRIVRSFVSSAIDRLDSIYIRSALEQGSGHVASAERSGSQERISGKYDGVKESPALYVH